MNLLLMALLGIICLAGYIYCQGAKLFKIRILAPIFISILIFIIIDALRQQFDTSTWSRVEYMLMYWINPIVITIALTLLASAHIFFKKNDSNE